MFGELLTPMHMLIILVVVLIIFGPKRLPELGKSLGKGIKEFKKATTDIQDKLGDEDTAAKIEKADTAVKEPMQAPEAKVAPEPQSPKTKTS